MRPVRFLSVDVVLDFHTRVIREFGGDTGLRNRGLLESAVAMPRAVFAGEFLHTSIATKAAAYHFHLCANHPFVDGNKPVAVVSSETFLLINDFELAAGDDEVEKMTLAVAGGVLSKEDVLRFFEEHVGNIENN